MDRTYQIVTNLSCNLDCEYCYERKYARNNNIDDAIDFLHACFERDKDLNGTSDGAIIDFIGGEPFMQPKLLYAAMEEAEMLARKNNRPYIFSISTNGTLFNKPINQQIIKQFGRKMSIGVSIDGVKQTHDKYRIYANTGNGSYDDAVAGYQYLKTMPLIELGIKATYTLETLPFYKDGMKNLIDIAQGGTISGNVVYEDVLPRSMAVPIANQMIEVLEYWIDKGLHKDRKNSLPHIAPHTESGLNIDTLFDPDYRDALLNDMSLRLSSDRVRPFCGSVKYMTCLGFDRNIYGCNRFMSTVTTRNAIGKLVGRDIVLNPDNHLAVEIDNQYKNYPDSCLACPAKLMCGSCAAAPYENKDGGDEARREYHSERRQCGWTMAKVLVSMWWEAKFGTYDAVYDKCACSACNKE